MNIFDLRSDTLTRPTEQMRDAMRSAEVGDDVFCEDPTVARLERMSADLLNKEAALFVPSGTFANQLAIFAHCERGDEIILSERSHIFEWEAGAPAVIAGVQTRTVEPTSGFLTWADIDPRIRRHGGNIHCPDTGLICLENALAEGGVVPIDVCESIYKNAAVEGVPVHIDGARLFNAAHALGVEPNVIANQCDSISFCLSKVLSAPVGSILLGSSEFIEIARKKRKLMGGGLRQVGVLAAAGVVGIENMVGNLVHDNDRARRYASCLSEYPDLLDIDVDSVETNLFHVGTKSYSEKLYLNIFKQFGILALSLAPNTIRFVFSSIIDEEVMDCLFRKTREALEQVRHELTT